MVVKRLKDGICVIDDLGIWFNDFVLGHLGFNYKYGGVKAINILVNEFCILKGLKLYRLDNPDVFVNVGRFYLKNGRRVFANF